MYTFPITLLTFHTEIILVKTSFFHLCDQLLPESYCNHWYTLLHQPPVPEPAFGVMGTPVFSGCGYSGQRAFPLDPGPYSPMPLRVLEASAKPQAHLCNSSRLNFINSLTHFFSPTLNSLMEISWHYSKAFASWAEWSRWKPKTAIPQEFEQSKGF